MTRRLPYALILIAAAAGCGDDGNTVTQHDAAIDVAPPPIDAPPPPVGHYYYVVDKVNVPTTSNEARMYAIDLDADASADNQLGMVMSTLSSMGFPMQVSQDKAIDTGAEIMLADLYTTDFTTTSASSSTFTIYKGSNPMPSACAGAGDTACRHHLTGMASFTALATPADPALAGNFVNSALAAGPGHLSIQIAFPDATPVTVTLLGARVKLSTASPTALGSLVLAGGISSADLDGKVVPAMQMGFMAAVTRDCTMPSSPGCGCANDSTGKTAIGLFDADHSCTISVDEIRNNSLIQALLATDVTLESQPCVSVGLGAHAVPAGFIAP